MTYRHPDVVAPPPAMQHAHGCLTVPRVSAPACFCLAAPTTNTSVHMMNAKNLLRRRERGSAVVEMALIAPLVILLLIGIIEMSLVFYTTLTMQYAVREGARYAVTGRVDKDPATANQQRYLAVVQAIKNNSAGLYTKVNPVISVNGTVYASSSAYSSTMFGGPGDIVVIRLDCTWPLATPLIAAFFTGGKYKFAVAATMQNESFP